MFDNRPEPREPEPRTGNRPSRRPPGLPASALLRLAPAAVVVVILLAAYLSGVLSAPSPANGAPAQAAPSSKAYIGLFEDNAVAVFDTGANRVLRTIPVPPGPHGLAISPDGKRVYVSSDGASTVSIVDTDGDAVVGSVDVGQGPHGLAITPDGAHVLVAVFGSNQVVSIETATNKIVGRVYVANPHNIAISPDGRNAYVAAQKPDESGLVIVDAASLRLLGNVPLDKTPRALSFSPDGKRLYYTLAGSDAVQVLDPATGTLVNQIQVGASPHLPAFTPKGDLGLAVVQGTGELVLVDPASEAAVGRVKVGELPHWSATSPDGRTAYVTNETSGDLSVVDLAARKVVATVPIGNAPRKIVVQGMPGMPAAEGEMAMGGATGTPALVPTPSMPAASQGGAVPNTVRIAGFAFSQRSLVVAPGTTVTWVNSDAVPHTVTSDDGKFDSGAIPPGGTFQHTFEQAGAYAYHCSIHPSMRATVVAQG